MRKAKMEALLRRIRTAFAECNEGTTWEDQVVALAKCLGYIEASLERACSRRPQ